MQSTQSSARKVFFVLVLAINKEVIEIEVSFLVLKNYWHNSLFFDSYSI